MFNVSVTLGVLNFSLPELHKLVLQGKKCIKWHKYSLVIYGALAPVQWRWDPRPECGITIQNTSVYPSSSYISCVGGRYKTPFGELINSANPLLLGGYNRQLTTDKDLPSSLIMGEFHVTQSKPQASPITKPLRTQVVPWHTLYAAHKKLKPSVSHCSKL